MTKISFLEPLACYSLSAKAGDPAYLREKASLSQEEQKNFFIPLCKSFTEHEAVFFVSTCHRVEIYIWSNRHREIFNEWTKLAVSKGIDKDEFVKSTEKYFGVYALNHMFRVCSGLESEVLGETQILGQFKDAVSFSKAQGFLCGPLERATQLSFKVAKRVRNETAIGEGTVSIAHAALEGLSDVFEDIGGKSALVVGAGTMALQSIEKLLAKKVQKIYWANRSLEKIQLHEFTKNYPEKIEVAPLPLVPELIFKSNFSIFATAASEPIIRIEEVKNYLQNLPKKPKDMGVQVLIDMGLPRNVGEGLHGFKSFVLRDVDEFSDKSLKGHSKRQEAVPCAEKIIDDEIDSSITHWNSYRKSPLLKDFFTSFKDFEKVTQDALQTQLPVDKSAKIEYVIHSIYGKLSHGLLREIESLGDDEMSSQLLEIFTRACKRAKTEATKE